VHTTIAKVVLKELLRAETHEAIASLVDLRIIGGAGLAHLLDTILEEVVVGLGVVLAESPLEVGVLGEVELKVEDLRAGTALLDTVLVPVVVEFSIVVVEGVLEVRILVVIEVGVEDKFVDIANNATVVDGREAHSGHQTLRIALVLEVPEELAGREAGEPWVHVLVDLRVIDGAGLTELVDTVLEEVVVGLGVVLAESLLEIGVLAEVELEVKDGRACAALLDTVLVPVVVEFSIVVVESILKIRILVVIEIRIEHDLLHVHGTIRGNTSQHHFRKGFINKSTVKE